MKSVGLRCPRCYICGAIDGDKGAVVQEATDTEIFVKQIPVGVALCSEHAWMDDHEMALAKLIADDPGWKAKTDAQRKLIAMELIADLEHDAKEMAAWSNKFGGW